MHPRPATRTLAALALMLALAALAAPLATAAEEQIHYTHESLQQYQRQLAAGQVESVVVNKKVRSLHIRLKDGRYVLALYAPKEEPALVSALQAKGIPVSTLKPPGTAVKKPAVHHKLRYIAGGILIAVIVIVVAVLLIDRRRKAPAADPGVPPASTPEEP